MKMGLDHGASGTDDGDATKDKPHISPLNACGACEGEGVDAERLRMRYSGGGELAVYISWVERGPRVIEILFATYQILREALISSHLTVGSHCMKLQLLAAARWSNSYKSLPNPVGDRAQHDLRLHTYQGRSSHRAVASLELIRRR